jgi:hypothetical protein
VDHIVPVLLPRDAARLAGTSKALRGLVREHFTDLGKVPWDQLRAVLTCFPKARRVEVGAPRIPTPWFRSREERQSMMSWLREGGRGRYLAEVRAGTSDSGVFVKEALEEGALPSLTCFKIASDSHFYWGGVLERVWTDAHLTRMHELDLTFMWGGPEEVMRPSTRSWPLCPGILS